MEELTHWKTLRNLEFLGSHDLPIDGSDIIVTIDSVKKEKVKTERGQEQCTVARFKEKGVKPMILNSTNCKTIQKVYNTPFIQNWSNKKIQLFVQKNVISPQGLVDALRIRPFDPSQLNKEPTQEEITSAINSLTECENKSLEELKKCWMSIPLEVRQVKSVEDHKDSIKTKLEQPKQ